MRSVIVYLKSANEDDVLDFLQTHFDSAEAPPWYLKSEDNIILTITAYSDFATESSVQNELGYSPAIAVLAEVSKRHPGDAEIRFFVSSLLNRFEGHAGDEYSNHAWTIEEIESETEFEGHKFFDYE